MINKEINEFKSEFKKQRKLHEEVLSMKTYVKVNYHLLRGLNEQMLVKDNITGEHSHKNLKKGEIKESKKRANMRRKM